MRYHGVGTDIANICVVGIIEFSENDYIELYVMNSVADGAAGKTCTIESCNFTLTEV